MNKLSKYLLVFATLLTLTGFASADAGTFSQGTTVDWLPDSQEIDIQIESQDFQPENNWTSVDLTVQNDGEFVSPISNETYTVESQSDGANGIFHDVTPLFDTTVRQYDSGDYSVTLEGVTDQGGTYHTIGNEIGTFQIATEEDVLDTYIETSTDQVDASFTIPDTASDQYDEATIELYDEAGGLQKTYSAASLSQESDIDGDNRYSTTLNTSSLPNGIFDVEVTEVRDTSTGASGSLDQPVLGNFWYPDQPEFTNQTFTSSNNGQFTVEVTSEVSLNNIKVEVINPSELTTEETLTGSVTNVDGTNNYVATFQTAIDSGAYSLSLEEADGYQLSSVDQADLDYSDQSVESVLSSFVEWDSATEDLNFEFEISDSSFDRANVEVIEDGTVIDSEDNVSITTSTGAEGTLYSGSFVSSLSDGRYSVNITEIRDSDTGTTKDLNPQNIGDFWVGEPVIASNQVNITDQQDQFTVQVDTGASISEAEFRLEDGSLAESYSDFVQLTEVSDGLYEGTFFIGSTLDPAKDYTLSLQSVDGDSSIFDSADLNVEQGLNPPSNFNATDKGDSFRVEFDTEFSPDQVSELKFDLFLSDGTDEEIFISNMTSVEGETDRYFVEVNPDSTGDYDFLGFGEANFTVGGETREFSIGEILVQDGTITDGNIPDEYINSYVVGQEVSGELSLSGDVYQDYYHENGDVSYVHATNVVLDTDSADNQVISQGTWTDIGTVSGTTEANRSVSYSHNFSQSFSEEGEYAYAVIAVKSENEASPQGTDGEFSGSFDWNGYEHAEVLRTTEPFYVASASAPSNPIAALGGFFDSIIGGIVDSIVGVFDNGQLELPQLESPPEVSS